MDQRVFEHYLARPGSPLPDGDIVELGAYMGRSAVLMGQHLQGSETFYVCDLFGTEPDDHANHQENSKSYKALDRTAFENNYLALHEQLPVVIEGPSSLILDHVAPASVRFVHVDASHLYDHVLTDLQSARTMLKPGGVVCFDDYRSRHTPGVSAVVWGAVATGELHAIAATDQKLYGTFDPDTADDYRASLAEWAGRTDGLRASRTSIRSEPMYQLWKDSPAPKAAPAKPDPLDRITKQLTSVEKRLGKIEKSVSGIQPGLTTKLVRKVRAARSR